MSHRALAIFVAITFVLVVSFLGFFGYVVMLDEDGRLAGFVLGAGAAGILLTWIWIGFSVFLSVTVLGRVDELVDPGVLKWREMGADPFFMRYLRLINYGGASASRVLNRRTQPNYDFSTLPDELRTPLTTFFIMMLFCVVLMFGSAGVHFVLAKLG